MPLPSRMVRTAHKLRQVAGMDRQKLDEAFQYAQETSQHGGLLVARHGWLVYEKYFGRGNREANPQMASCGKAFTSIACGIMLKEKRDLIPDGLDEKVFTAKYLPGAFPLSDPGKADIKLGHLLTMTSGMREGNNPGYVRGEKVKPPPAPVNRKADIDWAALHTPQWCKPGEGYSYSTASTHVASIVLRRLVGMELEAVHRPAAGQADAVRALGLRQTHGRRHAVAHTGRIRHRAAVNRCAALCLPAAAQRAMERTRAGSGRLHCAVLADVALQSAFSVQPAVRGE